MLLKLRPLFFVLLFGFTSCAHQNLSSQKNNQDHLIAGTLWFQTSAEYRALAYQAYNVARDQLERTLKSHKKGKPLAIVLDSDETIVDNGAYQATNILENRTYSADNWKAWVDKAAAGPIPGCLEFLKYAAKNKVEIFIVTNRKDVELEATYKNLMALNYPIKKENILVKGKSSSKEERRQSISEKYDIAILVGDNMADFSALYEKKNAADRNSVSDSLQKEFGHRMIVLPNPMYGDWESALYNYDFSLTEEQRTQIRKRALNPIK